MQPENVLVFTRARHWSPILDKLIQWTPSEHSRITFRRIFIKFVRWVLGTAATIGLLYQPLMIGDGDRGEIGGMKIGRGKRSTRRKHAPAPLCPPQIPHGYTRV
jgi:hypothetical protein